MKLFSDGSRSYLGPADESESLYDWLSRSARPIAARGRELLECWFSEYPQNSQADLRSRIRDVRGMDGAFFELYIHALLVRLGYSVTVHPGTDGQAGPRPDLLVSGLGEPHFYIEASVITEVSDEEASAKARMDVVYETFNRMDSPDYFLGFEISGAPTTPPPGAKMRRGVESWLARLDYADIVRRFSQGRRQAMPTLTLHHDGMEIRVFPIPKSEELRGTPGVRPVGLRIFGAARAISDEAIRDAVADKAAQLPELSRPYVLALNALQLHSDRDDVLSGLFGTDDPTAISRSGVARPDPRGAFFFAGAPVNTRVSAVFVALALRLWTVASSEVRLFANPWASAPYCGRLCQLPRVAVDRELEYLEGRHPREVLGLRERWYEDGTAV